MDYELTTEQKALAQYMVELNHADRDKNQVVSKLTKWLALILGGFTVAGGLITGIVVCVRVMDHIDDHEIHQTVHEKVKQQHEVMSPVLEDIRTAATDRVIMKKDMQTLSNNVAEIKKTTDKLAEKQN